MVWRHTMTSCDIMMSRHDNTWHLMSWQRVCMGQPIRSFENPRFSTWRPWPLTYNLDLRTHARYYQGTYLYQILGPYFEPFSQESADRHTHTHRRDRFHTLDRWRGREQCILGQFNYVYVVCRILPNEGTRGSSKVTFDILETKLTLSAFQHWFLIEYRINYWLP